MRIIDKKTGKRIDADQKAINKKLKADDPLMRNTNKELEVSEHSPMDPPEAYDAEAASVDGMKYKDLHQSLQVMMDEHKQLIDELNRFETALAKFHESTYVFSQEVHDQFNRFFLFFDDCILPHNRQEERVLFPILHKKLIEDGEHGVGKKIETAVDIMEDDHVKFIQLASLTFNLLGLASRLPDLASRAMTFDIAYHNGKELAELIRLHIFREDHTVFPLAQKLLSPDEFNQLLLEMHIEV
ncbi:hemerythrin domain-containing protein [Flavobacteriales bacterium]|nr:hemerythrin domain-containing protein [Flavobacteriales bacterium]